jgi:hypothetical protein
MENRSVWFMLRHPERPRFYKRAEGSRVQRMLVRRETLIVGVGEGFQSTIIIQK